jgi:hypothetical protein
MGMRLLARLPLRRVSSRILELTDSRGTTERELPASFYEEARRRTWFILAQGHVPGG